MNESPPPSPSSDESGFDFGLPHQRTIEYFDPSIYARAVASGRYATGRDMLQAMLDGELPGPPVGALMGLQPVEFGDGHCIFECHPHESFYSPLGTVHAGVVTTLLDTAMACSVHTTLPINVPYTTLEIKVNFVRSLTVDSGTIRGIGKVLHKGRSTAVAEARAEDLEGKTVAHATTTCLILEPRS